MGATYSELLVLGSTLAIWLIKIVQIQIVYGTKKFMIRTGLECVKKNVPKSPDPQMAAKKTVSFWFPMGYDDSWLLLPDSISFFEQVYPL